MHIYFHFGTQTKRKIEVFAELQNRLFEFGRQRRAIYVEKYTRNPDPGFARKKRQFFKLFFTAVEERTSRRHVSIL